MYHELSVIERLVADRQHAFRTTAAAGRPERHDTIRVALLPRSFRTHRRATARTRRWTG